MTRRYIAVACLAVALALGGRGAVALRASDDCLSELQYAACQAYWFGDVQYWLFGCYLPPCRNGEQVARR